MSDWPAQAVIYEMNTAVWLHGLSEQYRTAVTLDRIPQPELDRLAGLHFDGLWLMGVWQRSPASQAIAREDPALQNEFSRALPGYTREDVLGSPYAICKYEVDSRFGGDAALRELRRRLRELDIRLILDFVPNHVARDHAWVKEHPEYLVQGTAADLQARPHDYFASGGRVFAHGRDPNFPGWTDTVQIDYRRPETRTAVTEVLLSLAAVCDGLRCDMAMLPLAAVFRRTWGGAYEPPGAEFWVDAIRALKAAHPRFLMAAEAYWDLEYDLQQQGFDYTYDKRLYERLLGSDPEQIRRHLFAEIDYQRRLVRFIENHDEPRAAAAFGVTRSMAVATLALTLPGMRLIHEGQMEGRTVRIPVQLARRPAEQPDPALEDFYRRLLGALKLAPFHEGYWKLLQCREAWAGNGTYSNFVAHRWTKRDEVLLIVANVSGQPAQCYLPLDFPALTGCTWELCDLLSDVKYERDGDALLHPGLYLDVPGYGRHIFQLRLKDRKLPAGVSLQSTWQARNQPVYDMSWSPDGRQLALAGNNRRISIVDADSGIPVRELAGHKEVVGAVAWRPTGGMIASGSDDRTVRIWTAETGDTVRVLDGPSDNILTVAWSPDGRLLAASGIDRRIFIWDLKGGRPVQILGGQKDAVNCLAWSPTGGNKIAAASGDQTVHVWDVATSELLFALRGMDWVSSAAWSPDGKILVTGTGAGTLGIWNGETGRQISIREGHTQRVLSVAFSPDGKLLASKSADATVRFWYTGDWRELAVIPEFGQYLSGLEFQRSQPVLATRDDAEKGIRIWRLDSAAMLSTQPVRQSVNYASAKVVVVGDSSTGKTCLVNALLGKPFAPQPSTHAMEIALFRSDVVPGPANSSITREVMLWDLAGQSDYQLIHQLFLDQTALALVLFDGARQEDPLAGVTHWENALRRLAGASAPAFWWLDASIGAIPRSPRRPSRTSAKRMASPPSCPPARLPAKAYRNCATRSPPPFPGAIFR